MAAGTEPVHVNVPVVLGFWISDGEHERYDGFDEGLRYPGRAPVVVRLMVSVMAAGVVPSFEIDVLS